MEDVELLIWTQIKEQLDATNIPRCLLEHFSIKIRLNKSKDVEWAGLELEMPGRHRLLAQWDKQQALKNTMGWSVVILHVTKTTYRYLEREHLRHIGEVVVDAELSVALSTALAILESQSRDALEATSKTLDLYFPERNKYRRKVFTNIKKRKS
jgi:hypothetical protein